MENSEQISRIRQQIVDGGVRLLNEGLVNYHTSKWEGAIRPSSEKELHCEIYRTRKMIHAALMANHGAVCVGRNLEETFVVCQVLEKACKAFIEAEFLGGAKSINKFEAHLMHQIYIRKYSGEADKNR